MTKALGSLFGVKKAKPLQQPASVQEASPTDAKNLTKQAKAKDAATKEAIRNRQRTIMGRPVGFTPEEKLKKILGG